MIFSSDVSSKKWTYKLVFTTCRLIFVCFLEESEDTKQTFWNQLTFDTVNTSKIVINHYDLTLIWQWEKRTNLSIYFYSKLFTDPMLVMQVAEQTDSESFKYNIYSTVVTAFTYVFPILILPLALPIATLRTCISRQCCVPRYKQPIGELIMTSILCLIYLGTLVGVVLPTLAPMLSQAGIEVSLIL